MTTELIQAAVRSLVTPLHDTLSVYLAAPPPSEIRPVADAERRWRALADRLREHGADQQTVDAVWTPLRSSAAIRCGVAVFAREGRVVYTHRRPGWDGPDLATFGAPAHVTPLLGWVDTLLPYVVVVADRTGTEIIGCQDGDHPLASIRIITPPDHPSVAEHCLRVAHAIGASLVVAVGAAVDLPDTAGLVVEHVPGGSEQDRQAGVGAAVRRYAANRRQAVVTRFDNLRGPAGLTVEGLSETLAALADRRVSTLIVASGLHEHPSAWFADPPDAVALNPAEVFEHHQAVRRGPLADVAVRAALLAGADVCVLPPDTAGGPAEGLGALCVLERPADPSGTVVPITRFVSARGRRRGTPRQQLRSQPPRR